MNYRSYSFEKLEAWQQARALAKVIFTLTKDFPAEEKFGIVSQMRRSAVSVCSNLAEGSARITNKDKAHFCTQSYSSLMELLNQLILSHDFEYISTENYHHSRQLIDKVAPLISGLRKSILR